jgi:hypothetical protein
MHLCKDSWDRVAATHTLGSTRDERLASGSGHFTGSQTGGRGVDFRVITDASEKRKKNLLPLPGIERDFQVVQPVP